MTAVRNAKGQFVKKSEIQEETNVENQTEMSAAETDQPIVETVEAPVDEPAVETVEAPVDTREQFHQIVTDTVLKFASEVYGDLSKRKVLKAYREVMKASYVDSYAWFNKTGLELA